MKTDELKSVNKGDLSEIRVYQKLLTLGFRDVRMNRHKRPFDLQVDGHAIEVKYSQPSKKGAWVGCIQEHEDGKSYPAIAYVICLDKVPGYDDWVFLVVPGPQPVGQFRTTEKLLAGEHKRFIDNWAALQPEPYPLVPRPLPGHIEEPVKFGFLRASGVPKFIEIWLYLANLTIEELARKIRIPVEEIEDVMECRIPPSGALLYACGARMD
jgi:hypothetical protein